jgi:predicted ATP-dependent endonuclease of OLD family
MQISEITIHNFRSIEYSKISLGDYSLMVGANNSGKSNVIDILRIFYGKGLKYESNRDFPKFNTEDQESWIDIEFLLSDDEYETLKEERKLPENKVKVRKYFQTKVNGSDGKPKLGIYAYNKEGEIADDHFYGAQNVQQGKLGDIIYIPAVSKLDEQTKLTGPSPLRDLLNDILKKLVKSSSSFKNLTLEFEGFSGKIKTEETDEKKSLAGLERDITESIEEWDTSFELNINPVAESDIVKNLISYKIVDKALNERMEADQFGQGFQRYLIFTLIKTASKYTAVNIRSTKKEFKPTMTLLLFEEPEAFLHPFQQDVLSRSLKTIASQEGSQVFISSHSPYFVSHNTEDIPSVIRLCRNSNKTKIGQISQEKLGIIFTDNQKINEILKNTCDKPELDDLNEEMEGIKYFLWLNPERCGLFFSQFVLLVEGPTERVLFNYLIEKGEIKIPKGGVFILDCFCKYNIHRFMNLLEPFKIKHSILFDLDNDKNKNKHYKIKELIENTINEYTYKIDYFQNDLESFLGIGKSGKPHRKPQHVLFKIKNNEIQKSALNMLTNKIENLFPDNQK